MLWATARDPEARPRDAGVMLEQVRDTERLLATALPTGMTAAQKTMVLPAARAADSAAADAPTQVIGGRAAPGTAPTAVSDETAALTLTARRRRGKGWWLFAVVLVVAAIAGLVGWYFGNGPGSQVVIPDSVVNTTPEAATAILQDADLAVNPQQATVYSPDIVPGHVVGTKPAVGEHVAKGAEVQLLVSKGAEPFPLPKLVGQPQATADELVKTHWKLGTQIDQFDAKIPEGTVIDALNDATPPASLSTATTYEDQRTITLVVSAGAIPNVSGKTQPMRRLPWRRRACTCPARSPSSARR